MINFAETYKVDIKWETCRSWNHSLRQKVEMLVILNLRWCDKNYIVTQIQRWIVVWGAKWNFLHTGLDKSHWLNLVFKNIHEIGDKLENVYMNIRSSFANVKSTVAEVLLQKILQEKQQWARTNRNKYDCQRIYFSWGN